MRKWMLLFLALLATIVLTGCRTSGGAGFSTGSPNFGGHIGTGFRGDF